jgi:hypothetical protein
VSGAAASGTHYRAGENLGWLNLNDAVHFVAVGPCETGDLDCDGAVSLSDCSQFPNKLKGPAVLVDCPALDSSADL